MRGFRGHAGVRREGAEGGRAGEAQRRAAAAVEEEALRAHRGRIDASPTQTSPRPPSAAAAPRHGLQGEGAPLRQHEDRGLRGEEGQVRVLHRGDVGGQGDRLQVSTGRGLERRDHFTDGPV